MPVSSLSQRQPNRLTKYIDTIIHRMRSIIFVTRAAKLAHNTRTSNVALVNAIQIIGITLPAFEMFPLSDDSPINVH